MGLKIDIFLCLIAVEVGMVIFLVSYFPMKTQTDYIASRDKDAVFTLDDDCNGDAFQNHSLPEKCFVKKMFDRVIFLVIDALRADILDDEKPSIWETNPGKEKSMNSMMKKKMAFLMDLIRSHSSLVYKSIVRPPTVTLSGVKVKFDNNP